MGKINIINRTYYFYNDQINLKGFDGSLSKVDKKNYKQIDVYYIGYVTFKEFANSININSINPLFLMIDKMIGHFEEKIGNKYLVLDDVNENKEVSEKYEEFWDGIKKKMKQLMVAKKLNMRKILKKLGSSLMMIRQ